MALNNLITDTDSLIINDVGIGTAAFGMLMVVVVLVFIVIGYRRNPRRVRDALRALPTQLLYVSILLSILFSVCWIISCSDLASNAAACNFAMWGIIFSMHLINGLLLAILIHCGLLLSSRSAQTSAVLVKSSIVLFVCGSLACSFGGLITHRYGYLPDQDTCWIVPTANGSATDSAYILEVILLYGPIYTCLLLSFFGLGYVWIQLTRVRRDNKAMNLTKLKSLVLRLSFSPAFLTIHCLLVVGGDLPIAYHTRAAQFTSYICNYIGFSAYALALSLCAIFFDPALGTIMNRNLSLHSRSQNGGGGTMNMTVTSNSSSDHKPPSIHSGEAILYTKPKEDIQVEMSTYAISNEFEEHMFEVLPLHPREEHHSPISFSAPMVASQRESPVIRSAKASTRGGSSPSLHPYEL